MLARLGGDEFAVLLPKVRNRAEVEEIAQRLERCFDDPSSSKGILSRARPASASLSTREDGATKDTLLNAADAAMYAAKNRKTTKYVDLAHNQPVELEPIHRT